MTSIWVSFYFGLILALADHLLADLALLRPRRR